MRLTLIEEKRLEKIAEAHGADISKKPVGKCKYCGEKNAVFTGATENEVRAGDVACDYCVFRHRI